MRGGPGTGRDRRGASEVLGAIFVFAIVIAAIGVFQVTIVPQTNEEVEFKHSAQVRSDMGDLRAAMVSTGADGGRRAVSVRTGTSYPSRSVTINPPDPRGRLSAGSEVTGAVELESVTATDPEADDYWDGSDAAFDTTFVTYRPDYNYYRGAPVTRYEPTVVYSSFGDADVAETRQSLIDGRTLNVVLVSGSLSAGGRPKSSVDVVPVSTGTRSVSIDDPGPLRVRTLLSPAVWNATVAREPNATVVEYDDPDGDPDTPNVIEISLDAGTWHLRVAEVGLDSGDPDPEPAYVEAVGSTDRTVTDGEAVGITVRVLDRYGNPVEGVTVNQTFATNRTTGPDGTVTYDYAPQGDETLDVWFGSATSPADAARKVTFDVDVSSSSFTEQVNPSEGLVVESAVINDTGDEGFDVTFRSTAGTVTVDSFRMNYYHANGQGSSSSEPPEEWKVNGSSREYVSGEAIPVGDVDVTGTGTFAFKVFWAPGVSNPEVADSDLIVVTVRFTDGSSRLYFVSPEEP